MSALNEITVIARRFDGSVKRTWQCELISRETDRIKMVGVFDKTVEHADLGIIPAGTVSEEYYYFDRWYNIFRFSTPDGSLISRYCNINMPPTYVNSVLEYVDLDLDVVLWPDGKIDILDREEFEANKISYGYPRHVIDSAEAALNNILKMAKNGVLPI